MFLFLLSFKLNKKVKKVHDLFFFVCVLPRNKLIGTSFLFIYRLLYKRYHQWSNQILWKVPTFPDKPNEIFMESNLSQHYIFII